MVLKFILPFFFPFFFSFFHLLLHVKDFSGTTSPRILKFATHIGYNYLYRVRQNQHPHSYHSLYLSIFLFLQKHFLVKDFSGTTVPRILKYVTNIGYSYLYCIRENEHPHAYHFLYLSIFLWCHVCYVTGASNLYWLTVGQGPLSL